MSDLLEISPSLAIPQAELQFRFSRSGGPGGQHVNKTETRVELLFDVERSPSLSDAQRATLMSRLAKRIDGAGTLHLVAGASRSQSENRTEVTARFVSLLAEALKPARKRRASKPSRGARERRLTAKKRRGALKGRRAAPPDDG